MTQDPPGLERFVGETIAGRYRIERLLGEGGMGAVFKAHHGGLKRDVAVKLMHSEIGRDPQVSARFDREAQSASRLDHPNCVRVTDFGTWDPPDGSPPAKFMVMQYLEGHELADMLGKPLPTGRALTLMGQILDGLAHAHEHGIIHRDIKPENVFVTTDHTGAETLKIVDFGLAKIVSGEGSKDQMTKAGLVFGTPRYMSPEQAAGGTIDERTDLYACGIMMYEMLAGHPPFDADDLVGLLRAQIAQEPPPLSDAVPEEVRAIVMRLLQKSSRDRYDSARQLAEVLRGVAQRLEQVAASHDSLAMGATVGQIPLAELAAPVSTVDDRHASMPFPAPGTVVAVTAPSTMADAPPQPYVPASRRLSGARLWGAVAAGAAASGLVFAIAAGGGDEPEANAAPGAPAAAVAGPVVHDDDDAPAADDGEVNLASAMAKAIPSLRASATDLAALDATIAAKRWSAVDKQLEPLLDEYPRDPQLLWRRGKVEAHGDAGKTVALASYAEAMSEDPGLLDDETYAEELDGLLWDPALRDAALDVALQRMGEHGHEFLLELAALDTKALGYVDRHRVLDAVAELPEHDEFVDPKLQHALDAWQAPQALDPCVAFASALAAMEADPDAYYLGTLEAVPVPAKPRKPGSKDEAESCEGAGAKLAEVRSQHVAKFADAPRVVPPDYAPKKSGRRGRGSSGDSGGGGRKQPVRSFFRRLAN